MCVLVSVSHSVVLTELIHYVYDDLSYDIVKDSCLKQNVVITVLMTLLVFQCLKQTSKIKLHPLPWPCLSTRIKGLLGSQFFSGPQKDPSKNILLFISIHKSAFSLSVSLFHTHSYIKMYGRSIHPSIFCRLSRFGSRQPK